MTKIVTPCEHCGSTKLDEIDPDSMFCGECGELPKDYSRPKWLTKLYEEPCLYSEGWTDFEDGKPRQKDAPRYLQGYRDAEDT